MTVPEATLAIARIDLSLPDKEAAKRVREACVKEGFFYIVNHGVDPELIQRMFDVNKAFFALPMEEKRKIKVNSAFKGYTPLHEETLDPANQTEPDTKEGLYFGLPPKPGSKDEKAALSGPNQWPSEELVPGYRATTEEYQAAMLALLHRLNRLLALSLDLPADYFDPMFDPPMCSLRPLHYIGKVSNPEEGVFGAGAHTDFGQVTILMTDEAPGLQLHLNGEWQDVAPMKDAFIINLGDLLERWTNGRFRSTLHRVITKSAGERYSIPCFFEPSFNTVVECLPSCCGPDNPAKYPPITCGEHIQNRYNVVHDEFRKLRATAV